MAVNGWLATWRLTKYEGEASPENLLSEEVIYGNTLLLRAMEYILSTISNNLTTTVYNNTNARFYVGDNSTNIPETPNLTLMQGASTTNKAMDASYPSFTYDANSYVTSVTYQSTFTTSDANYAWNEFGLSNNSSSTYLLNRRVQYLGTKTSSQTWVLTCTYQFVSATVGTVYPVSDYIAYWKLGNATDSKGSFNLSLGGSGAPTYSSSSGKGDGAYADMPTTCDLRTTNLPTSREADFSITGWFYTTAWNKSILSFGYNGAATHGYNLRCNSSGTLLELFAYGANSSTSITTTISLSTWYFVVIQRRAGVMSLSVNGTLIGSASLATVGAMNAAGTFALGSRVSTEYMTGRLSAWCVYSRSITSAEISRLYASGAGLAYKTNADEYPVFFDTLAGTASNTLGSYTPAQANNWTGDTGNYIFTTRNALRVNSHSQNTYYKATSSVPTTSHYLMQGTDWWVQATMTCVSASSTTGAAFASNQPLYCYGLGISLRMCFTLGDTYAVSLVYRGDTQQWGLLVNGTFVATSSTNTFDALVQSGSLYVQARTVRIEADREYIRCYVDGSLVITQAVYNNFVAGSVGVRSYAYNGTLYTPTDNECLEISNFSAGSLY